MQFKDLWSALARRWYLLLLAIAVAIGGAVGVASVVGPTYETQAAVLILPPGSTGSGSSQTVGNPFLSLAGVSQVRDVVIRTMMSKTFLEQLCSSSGDAAYEQMTGQLCRQSPAGITFEATPDFTSGAPMILVTVSSESPTTGGTALVAITDRVPGILSELQADLGLRPKALISSTPVVMDLQPDVVHKQQIRAGLLAGVGLFGFCLLGIALLDGALHKKRLTQEVAPEIAVQRDPEDPDGSIADNWGWSDGGEVSAGDEDLAGHVEPDEAGEDPGDRSVAGARSGRGR